MKGGYIFLKLGEFVKDERLNRGLTQQDLAQALAVSIVTINAIENKHTCGIKLLKRLSEFFEVSIPELREMVVNEDNQQI